MWLASYPKSGNTWFRMIAANLRRDTPVDINDVPGQGGIASARGRFDATMLFPAGLLTHEECDRLRPAVHVAAASDDPDAESDNDPAARVGQIDDVRFIKTHDAWTIAGDGEEPVLGGTAAAERAILLVRDPRDVVASLAHHNRQTIDQAITFMARPDAALCGRRDRQHNQLRQRLRSWSGYHRSWLEQTVLPLHVLRYEDLHRDTAAAFAGSLAFARLDVAADAIARAVRFAGFRELGEQERASGFREAPATMVGGRFFRRGVAGGWRDELTDAQVALIERDHGAMMGRFGYARAGAA